ncbi:MAG: GNAT family N-acetyltransferase [Candidatus Thorarchaeota archaeon]|nr:GNAT family N-acetyltransferase [Candidatus Thorarchaeota archaeon]
MNITLADLIRVSKAETKLAVESLVHSFWNDPLTEYFFPDAKKRQEQLPVFMEYRVKQGLLNGQVFATSTKFEGIAIWKHSENVNRSLLNDLRIGGFTLFRKVGSAKLRDMMNVDQFTSSRREEYSIKPYLHLGPVGVSPEFQGKGYASKLIRPMLDHLNSEGVNCYLEAQNESNVSLYQHFGFEIVAKGTVPNTDIPHWDLIRRPE